MSWQDRLRSQISFISPERNFFNAKWIGGSRSYDKKLGIFDYPKLNGAGVQDLGTTSDEYPIDFIFDGPNHDLDAKRFFDACKETGIWRINHPVIGGLNLQLISINHSIEPVRDGNFTQMKTTWIKPIESSFFTSLSELRGIILLQKIDSKVAAVSEFLSNIRGASGRISQAVEDANAVFSTIIDSTLGNIIGTSATVAASYERIKLGISDTLEQSPIDFEEYANSFYELVSIASNVDEVSVLEKTKAYSDLQAATIEIESKSSGPEGIASVGTKELLLSSIISAQSENVSRDKISNRTEALTIIQILQDDFFASVDALDNEAENFSDETLDLSYFSYSQSFPVLGVLTAQSQRFIFSSLFDLSIEKTLTISIPKTAIDVCITEYGGLGENDENFNFFIETNKLTGTEILLLPKGKEIKVYV